MTLPSLARNATSQRPMKRNDDHYRTAEFFRRRSPIGDRLLLELPRRSREAFGEAIDLMDRPFERIAIP